MRGVALLGATGSIGGSTLKVITAHANRFRLVSIAAGRNAEEAIRIVKQWSPEYVAMADREAASRVAEACPGTTVADGEEAVIEAGLRDGVEIVVAAIVGEAGLKSTLAAARAGRTIALANKESLVMAGPLFRRIGAALLPVDSEHAALHQAIRGGREREVRRLVLTASGGPFRTRPIDTFESITVAEALAHPTWNMGPKITIDSATMVNKALEVIEAHYLFDVEPDRIEVLVHPQSRVHGMVEFVDGTILAQISPNDMTYPVQYALTWPERIPSPLGTMDLSSLGTLAFEPPDPERYPALTLAYRALAAGESAPAVLSAANEEAVEAFLGGRIPFSAIPRLIESVLDGHEATAIDTLGQVTDTATWARAAARDEIERIAGSFGNR